MTLGYSLESIMAAMNKVGALALPQRKSEEQADAKTVAVQWAAVKKMWAEHLEAIKSREDIVLLDKIVQPTGKSSLPEPSEVSKSSQTQGRIYHNGLALENDRLVGS